MSFTVTTDTITYNFNLFIPFSNTEYRAVGTCHTFTYVTTIEYKTEKTIGVRIVKTGSGNTTAQKSDIICVGY